MRQQVPREETRPRAYVENSCRCNPSKDVCHCLRFRAVIPVVFDICAENIDFFEVHRSILGLVDTAYDENWATFCFDVCPAQIFSKDADADELQTAKRCHRDHQ